MLRERGRADARSPRSTWTSVRSRSARMGNRSRSSPRSNEPVNSYTQPDLWMLDLAKNAKPRNLTEQIRFRRRRSVFGDNAAPRGRRQRPIWSADGKRIFEIYAKEGRTQARVVRRRATGAVTDITHGNQAVLRFRAAPDATKLVYLSSPRRRGSTISSASTARAAKPRQLTHVNDELFGQLNLTEPEEIWYESFDGKTHPGVGAEAAGFRSDEEISAHPQHPRRPARGLRLHFRARVPMDGGEGLRRALSESAREHELRPGIREHHPVQISRRRFQGPDGGRG